MVVLDETFKKKYDPGFIAAIDSIIDHVNKRYSEYRLTFLEMRKDYVRHYAMIGKLMRKGYKTAEIKSVIDMLVAKRFDEDENLIATPKYMFGEDFEKNLNTAKQHEQQQHESFQRKIASNGENTG